MRVRSLRTQQRAKKSMPKGLVLGWGCRVVLLVLVRGCFGEWMPEVASVGQYLCLAPPLVGLGLY